MTKAELLSLVAELEAKAGTAGFAPAARLRAVIEKLPEISAVKTKPKHPK